MSVGLESRAPFLDSRVFEYAWGIPIGDKLVGGVNKYPLRKLLAQFIPESLIERPKMGFSLPLGSWLRNELNGWAETSLVEGAILEHGFLDMEAVMSLWADHANGETDNERILWNILVFQNWYKRWVQ
jgi:asparagine synthase (glutamine-hydrolysing)